ncbi:NERD domain-containing protein [Salimicrobium flavidum]|uniref:Nuclease-related domain-containing protein n=1 Tax=Salimicrobium flavidum TaxID=570947 RepID=A0A1N7JK80_9BACI|nr:NERD domain-containing protein [Salimicrobium flavidum]SIS49671.1 Nuclease-related domain-containing protein [Salimicrobium flavidum]
MGIYRDSRVTRRCIIQLTNTLYVFSDNVLIETLAQIKKRIYNRDFYNRDLEVRATKILHKIEIDFEKAVESRLLKVEGIATKHSLEKIIYTDIVSPNEIDLLVLKANKLFVVECKNFLFKSDYKIIRSEVNRFKGEFSKKLNNKIQFVERNLAVILSNEFGIKEPNCENYEVEGLFVTNNFSISSSYEGVPYRSLNYTNVQGFFQQI